MKRISLLALRHSRRVALELAQIGGLNAAIGRTDWRRKRLLILCYHGVSIADEHEWSDLYVSPGHLERRLELLKQAGATILPLQQALELLKNGSLPERAVAITFDDGAHDFATRAMPILKAASAPATLYLTTYYCGRNQPVFDTVVSYLLWKARGRTILLPALQETVVIPASTSDAAFAAIHTRIRRYALDHGWGADEKNDYARELAAALDQDFDKILEKRMLQIMSEEEVRGLDRSLIDIQLHTHRHRTPRDSEGFLKEIDDNATAIRSLLGNDKRLNHFCYPSGDYVRDYKPWLTEAGVQWATTCDPGFATVDSDPYFLPRFIDTEPVTEAAFLAWVSGLSMFTYARRSSSAVRL